MFVEEQEQKDREREIIYLADPMCSWCWGFQPVIHSLLERYGKNDESAAPPGETGAAEEPALSFRLVMGGLRPGQAAEPLNDALKRMLRHHWREVEKKTGQPFQYTMLDKKNSEFLYDTHPAACAVVTMRRMEPAREFEFFSLLQKSFYAGGLDITNPELLLELAGTMTTSTGEPVSVKKFMELYNEEVTNRLTFADYNLSLQLGIRGFPSVVLRRDMEFEILTSGYQPLEVLEPFMRDWLGE